MRSDDICVSTPLSLSVSLYSITYTSSSLAHTLSHTHTHTHFTYIHKYTSNPICLFSNWLHIPKWMACFADRSETWRAYQSPWQSYADCGWGLTGHSVALPLASIPCGKEKTRSRFIVLKLNTINSRRRRHWDGKRGGLKGVKRMMERGRLRGWEGKVQGGWKEIK